jgi:hypothetical protein
MYFASQLDDATAKTRRQTSTPKRGEQRLRPQVLVNVEGRHRLILSHAWVLVVDLRADA